MSCGVEMKIFFFFWSFFMVSLNILSNVQFATGSLASRKEGWELLQLLVLKFLLHCVTAGEVEAQKMVSNGGLVVVPKEEQIGLSLNIGSGHPDSKASTTVHHHGRDLAIDDLLLLVEVEHVDGRHLGRGTAGAGGPSGRGPVDQVGMRVLLQVHVLALPRAVVGLVALGGDNPVIAKVLKVHGEWVAAATRLWGVLVAVQARVPPQASRPL